MLASPQTSLPNAAADLARIAWHDERAARGEREYPTLDAEELRNLIHDADWQIADWQAKRESLQRELDRLTKDPAHDRRNA